MLRKSKKIMAISSGGGHWVQLLRLVPAFSDCDLVFVTVDKIYMQQVADCRFYSVNDATRWNKFGLIVMAIKMVIILVRERPDVVVTTGAAPGVFGIIFGRLLRCRTIWIDSIANVERTSMSGQRAGKFADLWLTQWPHLAKDGGPTYLGAVL